MLKLVSTVIFILSASRSVFAEDPSCTPNPSESLRRTVVGIERIFDPDEIFVDEHYVTIYGIKGSAWFLDTHTVATIEHVVTGAKLSTDWKEVRLFWSDEKDEKESHSTHVRVRLKDVAVGIRTLESIITLELEQAVEGVKIAKLRARPLQRNEAVVGIGYTADVLRFVEGRLAFPESDSATDGADAPSPYLPFEMVDREKKEGIGDRYALNNGSSGAPIFDCDGNVVAMVTKFSKQTMSFFGNEVEVTTPWGQANIFGVSTMSLLREDK